MGNRDSDAFSIEDFLRCTVSRRAALRYGLAFGGIATSAGALAGCTGGVPAPAPGGKGGGGAAGGAGGAGAAAGAPAPAQSATLPTPRAQTVIIGQGTFASYGNYNPFVPNIDYANGAGQLLHEYFYYLNVTQPGNNLTHWQSTGWEYDSGFTTATFHLDPAVHWNDGHPFTSGDVRFTIELFQKNPDLLIGGLVSGVSDAYEQASAIETPDDHTVVVRLKAANPRYHYNFMCSDIGAFLIVPEHVWSGQDPTAFVNDPPVFTGPYKLKEANRTLQYYLWEKDANYWNKARLDPEPAYVGYITMPSEADASAQDFKDGRYDQGAAYEETKALIQHGFTDGLITTMPDPCARAIFINCDPSKGILADNRMRWVVSLLLDRETIATSIWPVPTVPWSYPWSDYRGMDKWKIPSVAAKYPLTYDPARAERLLDEMGATKGPDGKRRYQGRELNFTIINPGPNSAPEYEVAQLLIQEFGKVGITANLNVLAQSGVYQAAVDKGEYDIRSEWGTCADIDPYQTYQAYSSTHYVPIGTTATAGDDVRLKDPALDSVLSQLRSTSPTAPAAPPLYRQALEEWFTQMPVIPYIKTIYAHQASTAYWTGWPTDDNLYQPPGNWWGSFMFVIGNLKSSGAR